MSATLVILSFFKGIGSWMDNNPTAVKFLTYSILAVALVFVINSKIKSAYDSGFTAGKAAEISIQSKIIADSIIDHNQKVAKLEEDSKLIADNFEEKIKKLTEKLNKKPSSVPTTVRTSDNKPFVCAQADVGKEVTIYLGTGFAESVNEIADITSLENVHTTK